jgi:ribosomal-protein-alanine N-acetyltransferase
MQKRAADLTSDCADRNWAASVVIDRMRKNDIDAVCEIDRVSFPSSWSAESYQRDLSNPNSCYLVARLQDEIIGYAGMWVIVGEAHISTLAVRPDRRRCGLGRRLLSHLIDAAHGRGATEITLEVREANAAARALYESFGFRCKGFIPHYYGDTEENAVVMALGCSTGEPSEEWLE